MTLQCKNKAMRCILKMGALSVIVNKHVKSNLTVCGYLTFLYGGF